VEKPWQGRAPDVASRHTGKEVVHEMMSSWTREVTAR
jgi:hypothetical protein